MKKIYLLIDEEKNVIAIYDSEDLAQRLREPIEKRLNVELTIQTRVLNPDLKVVGVQGMS